MKRAKWAMSAAVFSTAIAGSLVVATQATAAETSASAAYNGACGSGYKVVNSAPVGSKGTVYLTYNATTGKNCVVTVRNITGAAVHMGASLGLSEGEDGPVTDFGDYTTYAGPVYLAAKGSCVDWGGAIQEISTYTYDSNCGKLASGPVTTYAR